MKILRHCYLLVALLFAAGLGSARAQVFQWAKVARGAVDTAFVKPQASATDAAGNTYVAVNFTDSLRVGNLVVRGPRNWSMAMVKYDSTGNVLWARALTNVMYPKLAVDNSAGGVFITAYNRGGATWSGATIPVNATADFYAKCSSSGTLQWSNSLFQPSTTGSAQVVADVAGNAYITSTVRSNSVLASTTIDASQNYFFKINGAGVAQWVQVLHTTFAFPSTFVIGPKPGGGFLVGGSVYRSPVYLGPGTTTVVVTPTNQANGDGFLCSFDAAGSLQWSQLLTNTRGGSLAFETADVKALAADAAGNCYVTGGTRQSAGAWSTMILGGVTLGSGYFLTKFDAAGTLQWTRGASGPIPTPQLPDIADAGVLLAANATGVTVVVNTNLARNNTLRELILGSLSVRSPYNFVHYNAQGAEQWAVADAWPGYTQPVPTYFAPSGLGADARGNLYTVGIPVFTAPTTQPTIQLGAQTTVGKGGIVARLNAYANTLRGQVYFDQNGNGQQDTGEGVFPRQLTGILTQGSTAIYSAVGPDGIFQSFAGPGAYSLTLGQVPARYAITQPASGSYAGTFSGSNQLVSNQNFGVAPIVNQADVRITLTPYSTARPGFTTSYHVLVENMGTTTLASGTATVVLDSHFAYVSSTPSASVTGQTLTWTHGSLAPFARLSYDILLSLLTNTVVGTALTTTATAPLTGDVEPTDNTSTLAQTVVGSYDPNSMEVNYERITPAQVADQQWLEYTIHFQNLGTAAATSVLLSNTLDFLKLNPGSIQWITQSHNCSWSLTSIAPNTGLLTVRFLNINLPERNVDVIRSQGFVRFRVRARPTLALGEIIPNYASIVFDYNAPVLTNTATTTVFLATAALGRHDAPAWTAYPNPATDAITVSADLATAGPVRVELLNVLGRPVRQQSFTAPAGTLNQALNLQGLAAGIYVLRLTPPTGPATSRQVVLH